MLEHNLSFDEVEFVYEDLWVGLDLMMGAVVANAICNYMSGYDAMIVDNYHPVEFFTFTLRIWNSDHTLALNRAMRAACQSGIKQLHYSREMKHLLKLCRLKDIVLLSDEPTVLLVLEEHTDEYA